MVLVWVSKLRSGCNSLEVDCECSKRMNGFVAGDRRLIRMNLRSTDSIRFDSIRFCSHDKSTGSDVCFYAPLLLLTAILFNQSINQ